MEYCCLCIMSKYLFGNLKKQLGLMNNISFRKKTPKTIAHLPHPPPIGGALGPPPWDILPIRLLPPGGPGGLQKQATET